MLSWLTTKRRKTHLFQITCDQCDHEMGQAAKTAMMCKAQMKNYTFRRILLEPLWPWNKVNIINFEKAHNWYE